MADSSRWITHGTRRVYASPWVDVDLDDVEVPGGRWFEHHVVRFPRASVGTVVADDERVLLYRVFLATGVALVGEPELAEADRVEWIPVADVPPLMAAGQVPDGPSVTALDFFLASR